VQRARTLRSLPLSLVVAGIFAGGFWFWAIKTCSQSPYSKVLHHHFWLPQPQVLLWLVRHINLKARACLHRLLKGMNQKETRYASAVEVQCLREHMVLPPKANNCKLQLFLLDGIVRLSEQLGVPDMVVQQLQHTIPAHNFAPPGMSKRQLAGLTAPSIQPVVPATLPPLDGVIKGDVHVAQYGLTTQKDASASVVLHRVQAHVQELQAWSCNPLQLSRPKNMEAVSHNTWAGIQSELMRLLGFWRKFGVVPEPSLHHCLNMHMVLLYISFLKERRVSPAQLSHAATVVVRVVVFLGSTNNLSTADKGLLPSYLDTLRNLSHQLAGLQPPPKPSLQEQTELGQWIAPEELLCSMMDLVDAAIRKILRAIQAKGGTDQEQVTLSYVDTCDVMDAALLASLYGYLPPLRPSVVISIQRWSYSGPCTWPSCQHKQTCKGNRLEWRQNQNSAGKWFLWLVVPHHKSSRWVNKPITCTLPMELSILFDHLCKFGLPLLESIHDTPAHQPYLFLWPTTGKPVQPQQVSQLFKRQLLPKDYKLGPQKARSAFVTAMRAAKPHMGLDEQRAAEIMGHSLTMWEQVYDREHQQRTGEATCKVLSRWRDRVFQQQQQQQQHSNQSQDSDSDWEDSEGEDTGEEDSPEDQLQQLYWEGAT